MPIVSHKSLIDAAGRSIKKSSTGEQVLTGVVNGAAKVVSGIAGAVSRVTRYSKDIARKDGEPEPKEDNNGPFRHAYKILTDPKYAKKKALENTREHHRHMAPTINRIYDASTKLKKEVDDTSAKIEMKHGNVGKFVSKAAELIPEVLTAGSSTRARVANSAFSAAKDFGEGKSIAGAIVKKMIPGNTKASNIASNIITDEATK